MNFSVRYTYYTGHKGCRRELYPHLMENLTDLTAYKEFLYTLETAEYLERRDTKNKLIHYQALDSEQLQGIELLKADVDLFAAVLEKDVMKSGEELRKAIHRLSHKDKELIWELYYNDRTEREYAAMLGVQRSAVHKRKVRILGILKRYLQNPSVSDT